MTLMGLGDVTTSKESQLKEVRVGKLKNGKDEFTREMIKGGGGLDLETMQHGF